MHDPPYTAEAAQQSLVEGYIIVSAASVCRHIPHHLDRAD